MPTRRPSTVPLRVGGISLALLLGWAAPAAAHDGAGAAFVGEAGPYTVYAYDGEPAATPGDLGYTLILRRTSDGTPVDGADLTASVRGRDGAPDDEPGPVGSTGVANVYEIVLPDPSPGAWTVDLAVRADEGEAATELVLHGSAGFVAAEPSGGSTLLVAGVAGGTVLLGAGVVARRRRTA